VQAGRKRRWIAAVAGALAVGVGAVGLFRGPVGGGGSGGPSGPPIASRTAVQIARPSKSDLELREEAFIRDLRPLFLPTALNAAPPEPRMAEGRAMLDVEPPRARGGELEFNVVRELPPTALVNDLPAEKAGARDWVSADVPGPVLAGLGRSAADLRPLAPRGGFLEVRAAVTGDIVLAESIPATARPSGDKAWQPLELLASVDEAGLRIPLVVVESSLVDDVDAHFRQYLSGVYRVGDRLPPGFYRIIVGP
jgi:hypothetical protein